MEVSWGERESIASVSDMFDYYSLSFIHPFIHVNKNLHFFFNPGLHFGYAGKTKTGYNSSGVALLRARLY